MDIAGSSSIHRHRVREGELDERIIEPRADEGATVARVRLCFSDEGPDAVAHDEGRTISAAGHGWIANSGELRKTLERSGHRFISELPDELLVHGYESWGEDIVNRLSGGYAFAIWDERRRVALAARDRLGTRSLYYAVDGDRLSLASRPSTLAALRGRPLRLDPHSLGCVLALGYVPTPRSIWSGVQRLAPGCLLSWSPDHGLRIRRYWPAEDAERSPILDPGEWWKSFEDVVADHVADEESLAVLFSGGYDSTCLALALRRHLRPATALTVHSPHCKIDESDAAAAVARCLEVPHRHMLCGDGGLDRLLRLARTYDEPSGHRSSISCFLLTQAAGSQWDVALSGQGTEMMFGWPPFAPPARRTSTRNGWKRRARRGMRRLLDPRMKARSIPPLARAMRARSSEFERRSALHTRIRALCPFFLPQEVEAILAPLGIRFGEPDLLATWQSAGSPDSGERSLRRAILLGFFPDLMLRMFEDSARANSVDIRFPFLDPRLSGPAFLAERPPHRTDWFRRYLCEDVPNELMERPKAGFDLEQLWRFDWETGMEVVRRGPWVRQGLWSDDWEQLVAPGAPHRRWRLSNLMLLSQWGERWLSEADGTIGRPDDLTA